jgi:hypothetical protein
MYFKMIHMYGVIKVKFDIIHVKFFDILLIIGALCVYNGINDTVWNNTSDLSMLKKIAEINGSVFLFSQSLHKLFHSVNRQSL